MNKSRVGPSAALAMLVASVATGAMAPEPVDERVVAQLRYDIRWTDEVTAAVTVIDTQRIFTEDDLDRLRGKLDGRVVLTSPVRELRPNFVGPMDKGVVTVSGDGPLPIGAAPRLTIRAALWGAEESGLLSSRGYVAGHFGDRTTGNTCCTDHMAFLEVGLHAAMREGPFPYVDGLNNGRRWHK